MAGEHEDKDLDRILQETFTSDSRTGYVNVKGVCLPEYYNKYADAIENFKVRDDDIWLCGFPRSGTTWTQEMVWCIANDLDFVGAKVDILKRFPFLDFSILFDTSKIIHHPLASVDSISLVDKLASPRFIKSHLPFHLLPREIREGIRTPKIIYVMRNPKDTCISSFHHGTLEGYKGNFQNYCRLFLAGKLPYTPFWNHASGFWSKRDNGNILFLKYEEMKVDLASAIRKTADFLGKSTNRGWACKKAMIDTNIEKLVKHLSFESMKLNPAVNGEEILEKLRKSGIVKSEVAFIRKGETGQWKTDLTPEMSDNFDRMTREHFGDCDFVF